MLVSLAGAEARLYHYDPGCVRFYVAEVPLAAAGGCWVRRDLGERLQTLLYNFRLIDASVCRACNSCWGVGGQTANVRGWCGG
jgi:hypothetical protein